MSLPITFYEKLRTTLNYDYVCIHHILALLREYAEEFQPELFDAEEYKLYFSVMEVSLNVKNDISSRVYSELIMPTSKIFVMACEKNNIRFVVELHSILKNSILGKIAINRGYTIASIRHYVNIMRALNESISDNEKYNTRRILSTYHYNKNNSVETIPLKDACIYGNNEVISEGLPILNGNNETIWHIFMIALLAKNIIAIGLMKPYLTPQQLIDAKAMYGELFNDTNPLR